jgi:nitrate reductase gamma subunit
MKVRRRIPRLFRQPPRTLFDDPHYEAFEAPVKGPLFSTPVFYALLTVFGISLMLTADWFGLLLLNSEGVFQRIGPLNTVRVTAVLMTGIAIPSGLLMFHYKRLYSYPSDENVFFAVTFSLSFLLGSPCALTGIFG